MFIPITSHPRASNRFFMVGPPAPNQVYERNEGIITVDGIETNSKFFGSNEIFVNVRQRKHSFNVFFGSNGGFFNGTQLTVRTVFKLAAVR
jgi:hypothetical protein